MPQPPSTPPSSPPGPVLCIVSAYNASVTSRLLEGACAEHARRGGSPDELGIVEAPGAYELPAIAAEAVTTDLYRAVVCLGCIVRGETPHDEHIARAIAHEITRVSTESGVPVALGVLTVLDNAQADARAGGDKGNKGVEAMAAALDTADALDAIRAAAEAGTPGIDFRLTAAKPDKPAGIGEGSVS